MTDSVAATQKLDNLLQQPDTKLAVLPAGAGVLVQKSDVPAKVEVLATGGVKVGDNRSWLRRVWESWVIRIQALGVTIAGLWIMIPQETILGVIPEKYHAWGLLAYAIITAWARMRNL